MKKRLFAWILGFSFLFAGTARAEYMRCATYFSDAWPATFWNSEETHMDEELAQIAADGFNGIILLVPWKEFQPKTVPVSYNAAVFQKMNRVMQSAERAGLQVYLRVGYTWDLYDSGESCLQRYQDIIWNPATRRAWLEYLNALYQTASVHPNFAGGFMTWEDFWNYTNTDMLDRTSSKGMQMAQDCGYARYAVEHYSLEELSELYGEKVYSEYRLPFPAMGTGAMEVFYEFYDEFLMGLLRDSQQVFPGLSMEVRTDADYVTKSDGSGEYYSHAKTYGCENASYTSIMYGIPIGFDNHGQQVSAAEASEMTEKILSGVRQSAGKPVFVEQFLFVDNTPGYEHNVQIRREELNSYLNQVDGILKKYSMGYGIWTYRDYCDNKLYNAQFALDGEQWKRSGNVSFVSVNGNKKALLKDGDSISQFIGERYGGKIKVHMSFQAESENLCQLIVNLGKESRNILVQGQQDVNMTFEVDQIPYAMWTCIGGEIYLDDMKVYTYVQDGLLYNMDGTEDVCIGALRDMNRRLAGR